MSYHTRVPGQAGFGVVGVVVVLLVLAVLLGIFTLTRDKSGVHLKVSNGCKDTDLTLQLPSVGSVSAPFSLQATLTMAGQPVPNERVDFRVVGHDNHNRQLQVLDGYATTDAHGVAVLKKPLGLSDQTITFGKGGIMSGMQVEFDGNGVTDRTKNKTIPFYCGSKATKDFSSPLTVDKVDI